MRRSMARLLAMLTAVVVIGLAATFAILHNP
jgi:hypothetical protein